MSKTKAPQSAARKLAAEEATPLSGIAQAVAVAGSMNAVAKALGVTRQAVREWVNQGWVPLGRVVEIEANYGIARKDLLEPRLADLVDGGL